MISSNVVPCHRLEGVKLGLYSANEIKNISVKRITNPETFDSLLHPNYGGLYDPSLGPTDRDDLCETCGQNSVHCPGHLGHIELPLPVYHPLFMKILTQVLRSSCFCCHKLLLTKTSKHTYMSQMKLLDHGLIAEAEELDEVVKNLISNAADNGIKNDDLDENCMNSIDKHVRDILKDLDKKEARNRANGMNVTDFRHEISKKFMKTHMVSKRRYCSNCKAPSREVRSEYNSRLYLKALPKREAQKWASTKIAHAHLMELEGRVKRDIEEEEISPSKEAKKASKDKELESQKEVTKSLQQTFLTPKEVKEHLDLVWQKDGDFLNTLLGGYPTPKARHRKSSSQMFFIDVLPVIPSRFRPLSSLGEKRFENPQTGNLCKVLKDCECITENLKGLNKKLAEKDANKEEAEEDEPQQKKQFKGKNSKVVVSGDTPAERLHNAWLKLQSDVNCVMDSDLDKLSTVKFPGVRQLLEKKEGLFRKHMMGKRVDYAARSVISPDPYINTDEIGIPEVFATKLTYPQPVTPWNVKELRQAVINGPLVHPGAILVENEDGKKTRLSATDENQRHAIAKRLLTPSGNIKGSSTSCKKVYRHLRNGDVMLLNRQPTLHRPSIMAHKARVLSKEKTIRLHYSNCKSYNADFDGDEMNAHFPQNELARAEAYNIASTNFQYLVPKDGTPLGGLIQDHIVSGVRMTIRGRMFNRGDYQQLVFSALNFKNKPITLVQPCVLKPQQMWSGKQIVTTVLLNLVPDGMLPLNLKGKAKIAGKNWSTQKPKRQFLNMEILKQDEMSESEVIFRGGELLCGVLDKAHYGNTPYSLVHCCYELYGGVMAGELLSALARLFTTFLQFHGFTLGVKDILVTKRADKARRKLIAKGRESGHEAATKAFGLLEDCHSGELLERMQSAHHNNDGADMKELDLCVKRKTDHFQDEINKACIPFGLYERFPANNLQLMVQAGAKGSAVNCMQISCLLGQIELEGRRPPIMLSGRSLPSFLPYDTSPRAGGFVDGRFLTGIRPQEYFFHCMAGREGLVDTAVKTSRSGYLQRCLIKHLEGLHVNYDLTVRDSDGSVVQFYYGEDGLDILKTKFLSENEYPFMVSNYKSFIQRMNPSSLLPHVDSKTAEKMEKKVNKWYKKHQQDRKSRDSPFLVFARDNFDKIQEEKNSTSVVSFGRTEAHLQLFKTWHKQTQSIKSSYRKVCSTAPLPVISKLRPDLYFGAVPEKISRSINNYTKNDPDKCFSSEEEQGRDQVDSGKFRVLMFLKVMRSLVEPGEAVGLLAAQSIGEPSTQMTLNTFHFAGRAELNVTLGIPRLREILMTASPNIKTPTMDLPLLSTKKAVRKAKKLQIQFTRVLLSQVLQSVDVWESLSPKEHGTRMRAYRIRFMSLPHAQYKDDFHCSPNDILQYIERVFIKKLISAVQKAVRNTQSQRLLDSTGDNNSASTAATEEEPVDDDDDNIELSDDEGVDGDATDVKQRQKLEQHATYEAPDLDEQEIEKEFANNASENEDEETPEASETQSSIGDMDESMEFTPEAQTSGPKTATQKKKKKSTSQIDATRQERVVHSDPHISSYSYDIEDERWCEVVIKFPVLRWKVRLTSLIEKLALQSVVYETPGIRRCFLVEEKDSSYLKTDGVNFQVAFRHHDILDVNKLYTNDIHAVANTYGIEAAARVIAKEVKNVFGGYGIHVDHRHLNLVAEYMTYEGKIKAFNRIGIESSASPFQKMSFETTTHFLRGAVLSGDTESLKSPSSRLVVGRVVEGGTGCFDLLQPLC
ncbi:DNA-directed RNA polymerase I subunit RPA1-like [Actinia tenebrosa]|uniref:DNA-directed RNA polymerase subunit n=1 Tax=Actinia tenebrosa TaxID=6105 RepID=A0A6P8IKR8_ACTTE|nr:DNA-directed RNA polymerase I subunit RPA1-like [Actinia tenebrosa]